MGVTIFLDAMRRINSLNHPIIPPFPIVLLNISSIFGIFDPSFPSRSHKSLNSSPRRMGSICYNLLTGNNLLESARNTAVPAACEMTLELPFTQQSASLATLSLSLTITILYGCQLRAVGAVQSIKYKINRRQGFQKGYGLKAYYQLPQGENDGSKCVF